MRVARVKRAAQACAAGQQLTNNQTTSPRHTLIGLTELHVAQVWWGCTRRDWGTRTMGSTMSVIIGVNCPRMGGAASTRRVNGNGRVVSVVVRTTAQPAATTLSALCRACVRQTAGQVKPAGEQGAVTNVHAGQQEIRHGRCSGSTVPVINRMIREIHDRPAEG